LKTVEKGGFENFIQENNVGVCIHFIQDWE
jgi:hypothetical protein